MRTLSTFGPAAKAAVPVLKAMAKTARGELKEEIDIAQKKIAGE